MDWAGAPQEEAPTVGERVGREREEPALTQDALARRAGVRAAMPIAMMADAASGAMEMAPQDPSRNDPGMMGRHEAAHVR